MNNANSSFSTAFSQETLSESFQMSNLQEYCLNINSQIIKLQEDLADFKALQANESELSLRDCLLIKNELNCIQKESKRLSVFIDPLSNRIDKLNEEISQYHIHLIANDGEGLGDDLKVNDFDTMKVAFNTVKPRLIERIKDKNSQINTLLYSNLKLKMINQQLMNQIKLNEDNDNKSQLCVNCGKQYKIKDNSKDICLYHPGELNYYSCKGCGRDEYYTCCSKCLECLKGCKRGKHSSKH